MPRKVWRVANGEPQAQRLVDDWGNSIGTEFVILGSQVLDAGPEVNDELPTNPAFLGQSSPDTGITEGVVRSSRGFIPVAQGGQILADSNFVNADFTAENYQVARVQVSSSATDEITVMVTNFAPTSGTNLTSFWAGFHNGQFDLYDSGVAATAGLESLCHCG